MEQGQTEGLAFPATLKRVILQQGPSPSNPWTDYEECEEILSNAVTLLGEQSGGFQLVVLEELSMELWLKDEASGLGYFLEDARRDWADVISGRGKGCLERCEIIVWTSAQPNRIRKAAFKSFISFV